jgi:hypothetical protein
LKIIILSFRVCCLIVSRRLVLERKLDVDVESETTTKAITVDFNIVLVKNEYQCAAHSSAFVNLFKHPSVFH